MSEKAFKLPGSSYDELTRIIQSYGRSEKPVSLAEVAQVARMNSTVISRNNGFLVSAGIIQGERAKRPTLGGMRLAHALQHENSRETAVIWREIVESTDFLSKMLAAIRVRRGMDVSTFRSHLAYSAGEPKNSITMAGAGAVIEILVRAGLISQNNDQLLPVDAAIYEPNEHDDTNVEQQDPRPTPISPAGAHVAPPTGHVNISINIDVSLVVKPSELDGLGARLRRLVDEIASSACDEEDTKIGDN